MISLGINNLKVTEDAVDGKNPVPVGVPSTVIQNVGWELIRAPSNPGGVTFGSQPWGEAPSLVQ